MPFVFSTGLLSLVLFTATADATTRPPLPSCEAGDIRLELEVGASSRLPALCITPGLASNFLFDTKLARVEMEGREHFRRVVEATDSFMVVPSEAMSDLEPQRVTFYFADEAAPASLTFLLVVHPAWVARQVDIVRQTRPIAFYKQKAQDAESNARRCEEEKARLQSEQRGPGGLRGLYVAGLLNADRGVVVKASDSHLKLRPRAALALVNAWSYRSGGQASGRVAVELELKNLGETPWTLARGMLRGTQAEEMISLPEVMPVSIFPGATAGRMMLEFEANTKQAQGAFSLTLWDTDGRSIILDNVTFP